MNYESAEDAIITLLAPLAASGNIIVIPMPENELDVKASISKPQVWVSFNDSTFKYPSASGAGVQYATINFEIITQSKFKRGPKGCYNIMEAINLLLIGQTPDGFNAMLYLTDEQLIRYDDRGVWNYRQAFTTQGLGIQGDDGDLDTVLSVIDNVTTATNG